MKILQVNATCGSGSTGKICVSISKTLNEKNISNKIVYSIGNSDYKQSFKLMNRSYFRVQSLIDHLIGIYGMSSRRATNQLIKIIKEFNPDIVHIHNIHSHDINVKLLFEFLKKTNKKVFWTFHDCWAFTGYCPHFDMIGCESWKTECKNCPQYKEFSWFFDRSKWLFNTKKNATNDLDLTIITPSNWLANLVKQSFLKDYPIKVINNGIDLSVFKPTESDFRKKYNIEEKFVLLGVAFDWGERKGLDVFIELSKRLDDHFQIVLVGTNDSVDKILPNNIISIHRTHNQEELAEIYSAANLFINLTREENYPTVNMESIACGTPVITFDTGGSSEMLDETCGLVVPKNDIDALIDRIQSVECKDIVLSCENCIDKSREYKQDKYINEYVEMYFK